MIPSMLFSSYIETRASAGMRTFVLSTTLTWSKRRRERCEISCGLSLLLELISKVIQVGLELGLAQRTVEDA